MKYHEILPKLMTCSLARRKGWAGQNKFVFFVNASIFQVSRPPLSSVLDIGSKVHYGAHIDICTIKESQEDLQQVEYHAGVWAPSAEDQIADDWEEVMLVDGVITGIDHG